MAAVTSCPNVFPGLTAGDFRYREGTFHAQDVASGVWGSGTTGILPPVAIDLSDYMLRSIDQPASWTDFPVGIFAAGAFATARVACLPGDRVSAPQSFEPLERATTLFKPKAMDCHLLASDGEADHLHILVEYPPKLSISGLIKGASRRILRKKPDRYRVALSGRGPVVVGLFRGICRRSPP